MYPQSLSNTAWAYATIKLYHSPLMQAIASESLRKISEFDLMEHGNTAWAFARLPMRDEKLLPSLFQRILDSPEKIDYQAVHAMCCATWALSRGACTWELFEGRICAGLSLDATSYGFLLMHSSWHGDHKRDV